MGIDRVVERKWAKERFIYFVSTSFAPGAEWQGRCMRTVDETDKMHDWRRN